MKNLQFITHRFNLYELNELLLPDLMMNDLMKYRQFWWPFRMNLRIVSDYERP